MRKNFKHLTYTDRRLIETLYNAGERVETIAEAVGVSHTTIYRELRDGATSFDENGKSIYKALVAQKISEKKTGNKAFSVIAVCSLPPKLRAQRTWKRLSKWAYPNLKKAIFEKGISRPEMAEALGISEDRLGKEMNGTCPISYGDAKNIHKMFFPDMSEDELFLKN